MAYSGKFKPKNWQKYKGDPTKIVYRSLWELKVMRRLDENADIVQWASEEIAIPYRSIDRRIHRYYPDFWVKYSDGRIALLEVKPFKQLSAPKKPKRRTKSYLYEVKQWGINKAKWASAEKYCEKKGWDFVKLTERELYGTKV